MFLFSLLDNEPGDGTQQGNCNELYIPDSYNCHSTGSCAFCVTNAAVYVGSSEVGSAHSGCLENNKPICNPKTETCEECSCKDDICGTHSLDDEDTCRLGLLGECQWLRFEDRSAGCSCNPENNDGCPEGKICSPTETQFNECVWI